MGAGRDRRPDQSAVAEGGNPGRRSRRKSGRRRGQRPAVLGLQHRRLRHLRPQTYTPVVLDTAGSPANIAANIINAVASIPVRSSTRSTGCPALEVTGSWWVYTPTNVLGFDPADPVKVTALVDLAIPFKPISNVVGEHLSWWAKANLPMDAGCTANAGPNCPDADAMFAKMFKAGIFTLAAGYQFPRSSTRSAKPRVPSETRSRAPRVRRRPGRGPT